MLLLYDLVLGCFKLSIILCLCLICAPCLVYLIVKTTRDGSAEDYDDPTRVNARTKKNLTEVQLKKLLRSVFFKRKAKYEETSKIIDTCSICME